MALSTFIPSTSLSTTNDLPSTTSTTTCLRPSSFHGTKISKSPSILLSQRRCVSAIRMNAAELARLKSLPLPSGKVQAEYIWLDAFYKLRSKARTVTAQQASSIETLPEWNYDGSSTGQASGEASEVILKPAAKFRDPFRGGDNILVMCEAYTPDAIPLETNTRFSCKKVMDSASEFKPLFGLEQEYFIINPKTGKPLGFENGDPPPQGPYYCGVGADKVFGRDISDAHWRACLYAGLDVGGTNIEVAPGQFEFQLGPTEGIGEGDQLWIARYILERVAEIAGYVINYEPKPVKGDWNGSGCHTNFSTKQMREDGGYEKAIIPALEKLRHKHELHINAYGAGNKDRLTGQHETASYKEFKWGRGDRGASCRVGNRTVAEGKGYFEDRRPAGNVDPYVVTKLLVSTCCEIEAGH